MATNSVSRTLHDVGLAAWFGGTLANAVALNAAAAAAGDPSSVTRVTNVGWARWTPVNAAAIGLHLAGAVQQLNANKSRLAGQQDVATAAIIKTALTATALGITGWSRVLGKKLKDAGDVPASSGVDPAATTPTDLAKAQKQLKTLQWVIPLLTGSIVVITAVMGEQQRPTAVKSGVLGRLLPVG